MAAEPSLSQPMVEASAGPVTLSNAAATPTLADPRESSDPPAPPIASAEGHQEGTQTQEQETLQPQTSSDGPMCQLRVLLISGQYHTFSFEPETTIGRLKELIFSMWPAEWTSPAQPPSPTYLRILYGGRILSDESTLASNNFPSSVTPVTPTVVHLSVRSFSIRAEDDPKKSSLLRPVSSRPRNEDQVSRCRCTIM